MSLAAMSQNKQPQQQQRLLALGLVLVLFANSSSCQVLDVPDPDHLNELADQHAHQQHQQHPHNQSPPAEKLRDELNLTTTPASASSTASSGQIISSSDGAAADGAQPRTAPVVITIPDPKQLLSSVPRVLIDLSHPLDNQTLYWPALPSGFQYESYADGERKNERNESYYLRSDGFRTPVHCGTHLDAPRHFSETGWTVDEIPLERLIDVPVTVVDVSEQVKANRSYTFERSDFFHKETNQSLVERNSVVLVYTGISQLYGQGALGYFGATGDNISQMQIPGFSKEAAEYLVSVGVFGVGLDAASADSSQRHGPNNTYDPAAHVVFNSNNVYILENISNKLADLLTQTTPMRLIIAPLAIRAGSGSPVRLIAASSQGAAHHYAANSANQLEILHLLPTACCLVAFATALLYRRL